MVARQASRENHSAYQSSGKEIRRSTSSFDETDGREAQATKLFSLEGSIIELESSLENERKSNEVEVNRLRDAKKTLHEEIRRLKTDKDGAMLSLYEEREKHAKETTKMEKKTEGMQIALNILKKDNESEEMSQENQLSQKLALMKLETQIDELTTSNEEIALLKDDLQDHNNRLSARNEKLKETVEKAKAENMDLERSNTALKAEREELSNRNNKVVTNVTTLKVKSDVLQAENEKIKLKLLECQDLLAKTKVESLKAALVLEEENSQLCETVGDVQHALKEMALENQVLQMEIATYNGRKWRDDTEVTQFVFHSYFFFSSGEAVQELHG